MLTEHMIGPGTQTKLWEGRCFKQEFTSSICALGSGECMSAEGIGDEPGSIVVAPANFCITVIDVKLQGKGLQTATFLIRNLLRAPAY